MPQVDPKFTFWFGVWTNVLMLIAGLGIEHAPPLISQYAPDVQWLCGFFYKVNSVLLTALTGISSSRPGPLINVPPTITPTVVKILLVAFALSFLVAVPSAQAQTRAVKKPAESGPVFTGDLGTDIKNGFKGDPSAPGAIQLTGNAEKDMQVIVKRIQAIGRDDMNYAILKATAANTNGSKVRLQCLQAILAAKNAAEGTDIKDANGNVIQRPDPAVVTAIEDVAELVDALSPQGPLMTGCAGAAQLFKTNTLAAINGIVTGAAGIAALPAGL